MTKRAHFGPLVRAAAAGLAASALAAGCAGNTVSRRPDPPAAERTGPVTSNASPAGAGTFAADAADDNSDRRPDPDRKTDPDRRPAAESSPAAPAEPAFKLRGRIEADALSVTQSPKDKALFGNFENAVGFRRARLGAEGTAGEQTRWVTEFDFAGGDVRLRDAFLAVNRLPVLREVRVGHFKEPFTLEGQDRSVSFPFTERSPAFTFDPVRTWGVGAFSYTDDRRLFVQAGAFKSGTDNSGTDVGDGNDLAYTARVVGLPWYAEAGNSLSLLHVGGAASQRYARDDTVTFNQGPQSSLVQGGTDNPRTPFAPTVALAAHQYQLYNLQAAVVLGPLSVQAEWTGTRVEQLGGGPVALHGWYVLAGYFLTGEHRTYDREFGTLAGPDVRHPFACTAGTAVARGPGAWELAARLGYLDFDSPNLPRGPNGLPVGTRTPTLTLGVNWYLNDNARVMLDWVHAIPDLPPFGSSTADLFTVRSAIYW